MKGILKKYLVMSLTITALIVGITGQTVIAANKGNINLHKYSGAPGSDTVTYQNWTYTASTSKSIMKISKFTRSNRKTYLALSLSADSSYTVELTSVGSLEATGIKIGKRVVANAKLVNLGSGNYQATGKITG